MIESIRAGLTKPLVLVDIGIPPQVDATVDGIAATKLFNLDWFTTTGFGQRPQGREALRQAQQIVEEGIRRVAEWASIRQFSELFDSCDILTEDYKTRIIPDMLSRTSAGLSRTHSGRSSTAHASTADELLGRHLPDTEPEANSLRVSGRGTTPGVGQTMTTPFIIGSRGSDLALWQSRWVAAHLGAPTEIEIIHTQGDKILDRDLTAVEGKGFFTKELEDALYAKTIDIAVHSLKDLPTETPPGLSIAAVCERAPVSDVLLVHPDWYDPSQPFPVKAGGKVGASSLRRQASCALPGPNLEPTSLRGNVPTRVRKCREGQYAAVVLAEAGLSRLALEVAPLKVFRLAARQWLPAPGQGALGIETRAEILRRLSSSP